MLDNASIVWASFKYKEIFKITKGKRKTKNELTPGKIPFVSAKEFNNAIREYCDLEPLHPGNAITVNYNGSVGEAFYQPDPFWASDDVNIFELQNKELNVYIAMFLIAIIKKEQFKYNYGRKWTLEKMKETELVLPIDKQGEPDWSFMENTTKKIYLNYKNQINQYKQVSSTQSTPVLNITFWKEFRYDELFNIISGKGVTLGEAEAYKGTTPYISSTKFNNGVTVFTGFEATHKGNVITVAKNGSVGEAFYQSDNFMASSDVAVLNPQFNANGAILTFICAIIRKEQFRYNYGRKWSLKNMKKTFIHLPVDNKGEPDWVFMEQYIKSLSYSSSI